MEIRTIWADIIACLKYFYPDEMIEVEDYRFINFIDQSTKISLQDFDSFDSFDSTNGEMKKNWQGLQRRKRGKATCG